MRFKQRMNRKIQNLIMFFAASFWTGALAFVPQRLLHSLSWSSSSSRVSSNVVIFMAKKKKLSFAEKKKRRAEKQRQQAEVPSTPANIKFYSTPQEEQEVAVAPVSDDDAPEKQRAKEILAAQRESVNMLTHIRKCVDSLDADAICQSLESVGYAVIDDFCKDSDIISTLQDEGTFLQENDHMELDLSHGIGSGEYVVKIEGGQEQYKYCPRTVEWIVGVTKQLPPKLEEFAKLDSSASMGSMKTYSRKARMASIALLTGKEEEADLGTTEREYNVIVPESEAESDFRRLTLLYYPVSQEWDEECGGGITFEASKSFVQAKRDRLVLLKSDTCRHRQEPYKGREADGLETSSCIELHLVQQASS